MSVQVFVLLMSLVQLSLGSSIPVWELLRRQEKEINLYSIFVKNCQTCDQGTLKFALDKLKTLADDDLDLLDPYQRGADRKIFDTLLSGNQRNKNDFFEDFQFEGSAKIDQVYQQQKSIYYITYIIHVYPDGTPLKPYVAVPEDDDLHDYRLRYTRRF